MTYLHEEKGDRHTAMDGEYRALRIFRWQLYSHGFGPAAEPYLKLWFGFSLYKIHFVGPDVRSSPGTAWTQKILMMSRCDRNDSNNPSDGYSSRPMLTADEGS